MSLLITNGRIITASDDYVADVYCHDGVIAAIGKNLPPDRFHAARTIDASGKYVIPGGIDVHTHLNMPFGGTSSADDFESGKIAAGFGGTTSIVDFAIGLGTDDQRYDVSLLVKNAFDDDTPLARTWNSFTPATSRWYGVMLTGKLF